MESLFQQAFNKMKHFLPINNLIDKDKIPKFLRNTMDCIANEMPTVADTMLLNSAIQEISTIATSARCKVQLNDDTTTQTNIYTAVFASSGGGKDRVLNFINKNLLKSSKLEINNKVEKRFKEVQKEVFKQADIKFKDKEGKLKDKPAYSDYLKKNLPIDVTKLQEVKDGTDEGYRTILDTYQKLGLGASKLSLREFGSYITANDPFKDGLISAIAEMFDNGKMEPKITKSGGLTAGTDNVPVNFHIHTSTTSLFNTEKNHEKFKTFLANAFARRFFTCYPTESEKKSFNSLGITDLDTLLEQNINNIDNNKECKTKLNDYFSDVTKELFSTDDEIEFIEKDTPSKDLKNTEKTTYPTYLEKNIFKATERAKRTFKIYEIFCTTSAEALEEKNKNYSLEGLVAETGGRPWKMLKLAGAIASISHPTIKTVTDEDMQQAIYITEHFGLQFARFFENKNGNEDVKEIYDFIFENENGVNLSDLREQNFVHKNKFKKWFEEIYPILEEMALSNGKRLELKTKGAKKTYKLIDIAINTNKEITISSFTPKNENDTFNPTIGNKDYKPTKTTFNDLHKFLNGNTRWSQGVFENNHRLKENWLGKADIMAFDIDDGTTVKEAISTIENANLKALVVPSKSHQIDKGKKGKCDRFRVVFPLVKTFDGTIKDWEHSYILVAKSLNIKIDTSCKDISRFFFPNGKNDGKYYYTKGIEGLDLDRIKDEAIQNEIQNLPQPSKKTTTYSTRAPIYNNNRTQADYYRDNIDNIELIKEKLNFDATPSNGRNNHLTNLMFFFKNDVGFNNSEVEDIILRLNNEFADPLEIKEIERSIFYTLNKS